MSQNEEELRDQLLKELENEEWDMSDSVLEKVAGKMSHYFGSNSESKDFVQENASYLFTLMEDDDY